MRNQKEAKPLEYYLELNYPITIHRAEEGGFVAENEDLPGCLTQGETIEEAIDRCGTYQSPHIVLTEGDTLTSSGTGFSVSSGSLFTSDIGQVGHSPANPIIVRTARTLAQEPVCVLKELGNIFDFSSSLRFYTDAIFSGVVSRNGAPAFDTGLAHG